MTNLAEKDWQDAVVAYLKAELRRKEIDFGQLSRMLKEHGVPIDRVPLANKINRGTFSAGFLLQVLSVLGVQQKWLDQVAEHLETGNSQG